MAVQPFNNNLFAGSNVGSKATSANFVIGSGDATFSATYPEASVLLNGDEVVGYTLSKPNPDGSLTQLDTLTAPGGSPPLFPGTVTDTPNQTVLQSTQSGEYLLFSNTPVQPGQQYFFFQPPGDYRYQSTAAVCFTTGTRIQTTRGYVVVEDLNVGDIALTASGQERTITWIGQRDVMCALENCPHDSYPIRILAGAFGSGLPERDLWLSPGHPVLVGQGADEVLVPIMCLINGTSIERVPVETVTYWHVELDEHDILLAEGLPAESFLDFGNRIWFENGTDHALANPDFIAPGLDGRCRPVAIDGPIVEAERRRIDTLFHASLTAQCAWPERDSWLAA